MTKIVRAFFLETEACQLRPIEGQILTLNEEGSQRRFLQVLDNKPAQFLHHDEVVTMDSEGILTANRSFCAANALGVCVQLCKDGYKGGATARLTLSDQGGTNLYSKVDGRSVSVILDGDHEVATLIDALEFAAATLKAMSNRS